VTAGARWVPLVACGLAVFGLVACGGEKKDEAKPAWTVEETPNPARAGLPGPGEPPLPPLVVSESLPAGFPPDVPQYPGAKVKSSRSGGGAKGGFSVSFEVGDDAEKVASFYADSFAAKGWATDTRKTPEGTAVFAEKNKRSASALVRPGGDETVVDLIVVER
jgi:hypothetical protein